LLLPFDISDGFDAKDGAADASVAFGEPGMGLSWTLITVCRFETEG